MSTLLAPERPQNPFATPPGSGHSTPAAAYQRKLEHNYFKSRRLDRDHEIDKPWLSHKDPYRKWASLLPLIGIFLGIAAGGVFTWNRLRSVVEFEYCMIYEDDFSAGFDETVWTKEAQIDGYGNGQFEETTTTDENVFIVDGMLHM